MATSWVLMVALYGYREPAFSMQEFNDKQACLFARNIVKQDLASNKEARATCVPKATRTDKGETK